MIDVLQTAKDLLAKWGGGKAVYRMGADLDGDPIGCDCSAFAARCCGQRKYDGHVWWATDRIYDDANSANPVRWQKIAVPEPGCIGVYPGKVVAGTRHAGHVWIVADVAKGTTIECSSSGGGIASKMRSSWFRAGALGNGRPIIWARFIG